MTRENLLHLYEKLTGLVGRLPGGLQKPILNELVPIRQLFLEQRPARLLLLGDPQPGVGQFVSTLLPTPADAEAPAQTSEIDAGWCTVQVTERGAVQILDARGDGLDADFLPRALSRHRPDAVVLFQGAEGLAAATRLQEALALLVRLTSDAWPDEKNRDASPELPPPAVIALYTGTDGIAGVERLRALLLARRELSGRSLRVLPLTEAAAAAEALCAFLPNPAKLEFALLGDIRPAQVEIARSLLKSFTAVCGVIGMQPIPLADLPILTTLQSLMVGLIAYVSGRKIGPQSVTEFFGAVGVSVGLGMLFREGARALIKIVPGFGNAVSGMVAGAGTYAIGRAAIAYFIERVPAGETRRLFEKIRPRKGTFLWRRAKPPKLPE